MRIAVYDDSSKHDGAALNYNASAHCRSWMNNGSKFRPGSVEGFKMQSSCKIIAYSDHQAI